jgi:putative endonuclease
VDEGTGVPVSDEDPDLAELLETDSSAVSGGEAGGWFVYILLCHDGTLYTGSTTDLLRRVREHNSVRQGARYTRSRRPVFLFHSEGPMTKSEAFRRENLIKWMRRHEKLALPGGE